MSGGRTAAAVFASYTPRRRFVAVLVGAVAAFAIGAPVAGAAPWTGSGTASDGTGRTPTITVLSDGTDSPAKFHYDFVEPDPLDPGCCATGNFEFKTTASAPGTVTLDWNYRGHHAFFQVQAGLTAFVNSGGSDVQTVTLVSAGPTDCCAEPSGGFSYSGRVVLNITAPGDTYGFRMTGSNGDLNASLEGTLSLALVVDKTDDSSGGACDSSVPNDCSLRSAIEKANSAVGADGINFNIPGVGVHTITPDTALLELTGQVTIDGYTQPGASANTLATGNNAALQIELNGNDGLFDGLAVSAGGGTIQGLVINNFRGDAIELRTGGENRITGNFIGTNTAGTALLTSGSGIFVNASPGNWIGGLTPSERNVIAAAVNHAIRTPGPPLGAGEPAGGNVIQGNYVGTDKAGTTAIGVGGISLSNPNNLVGGTAAGARNVLSTVGVGGVFLSEADAHHNTIQGNHIGVNAAGTAMLVGSGVVAITLQRASENLIGGTTAAARNVIASASGGISIFGVSGPATPANNVIQGNYIGTDATGTVGMPVSAGSAILIDSSTGNTIGGTAPGAGNVLSRSLRGVHIQTQAPVAADNIVQGNFIGTNATGTAALGNSTGGVVVSSTGGAPSPSTDNIIGGTTASARNVISGNTGNGVGLAGANDTLIQGNYIGVAADGSTALGNSDDGVDISSGSGNVVGGTAAGAGNLISGNVNPGVDLGSGATGTRIEGNLIGTNAAGTGALGNGQGIRNLGAANTDIGGATAAERNVIAASTNGGGVFISGAGATGVTVQGNYIGTNAAGTGALGNKTTGVSVQSGAVVQIGGTASGAGNVISANGEVAAPGSANGIHLASANNVVQGNLIGTDVTGTQDLGNAFRGILIQGGGNTIGGTTAAARNLISGNNGSSGVHISTGSGNTVSGNYIGTNAAGTAALGNTGWGLQINSDGNTVGGATTAAGNVISANGGGRGNAGIAINGGSNVVENNLIGTAADGTGDLGNNGSGVLIQANLGTPTSGIGNLVARNVIAFNGSAAPNTSAGVDVVTGSENTITENSIFSNDTLGIDLGNWDGVTPNDAGDGDIGANELQNFPVVETATANGPELALTGTLNSAPNTSYTLEFFTSPSCDSSGNGEGKVFVGTAPATTDGGGNTPWNASLEVSPTPGHVVTATTTDPDGNTSEFSDCLTITAPDAPFVVNSTADPGTGVCDASECTLREAINDANEDAGADAIHFDIPGTAPHTIALASALPAITDQVTIDGTTEPDFAGSPVVVVNRGTAPVESDGFVINAPSCEIRGLVVNGFTNGAGIRLFGSSVVAGNYIGTNADGDGAVPNANGVVIFSDSLGTQIGGNDPEERNVISGNTTNGITDNGGSTAIQGNYIGTNASGTADLGNGFRGIEATGAGTSIGGGFDERNVISGNDQIGVHVHAALNVEIQRNYIGTDETGENDLGNGQSGIQIEGGAEVVTVGGSDGGGNLISGNTTGIGVYGAATTDVAILGNFIGTDDDGDQAVGNLVGVDLDLGADGVEVSDNLISANQAGMEITGGADSALIRGNEIGTDADGVADLGNLGNGVYVADVSNTLIGGVTAGARNVISGNGTGIQLNEAIDGTEVLGNYIGTNAAGTAALGNSNDGVVVIDGSNSDIHPVIGGDSPAARNVISGNFTGVRIIDSAFVDVEGNYIGTDAAGTGAIANQRGVAISGNSSQNTVGAAVDGPSNVISGNAQVGVLLNGIGGECAGQTVFNNLIGVGADGEADLGQPVGIRLEGSPCNQIGRPDAPGNVIAFNGAGIEIVDSDMNSVAGNWIGTSPFDGPELDGNDDGVVISGTSEQNVIGGSSENQRNVIANNDNGVVIESDGNEVQNNYIGTDWSGNAAAGNSTGVVLGVDASGNLIGGDGDGNVISGNSDSGVRILGSDNSVQGNRIGVGANLGAVPNQIGVRVEDGAADNLVGGATEIFCEGSGCDGESNLIAHNGGGFEGTVGGIVQTGTGTGNTYSRNRIFETGSGDNDALGIDLGPTGVTPNDPGDPDTGPNELQNFPVIENVVVNETSIDLSGELDTEQWSGAPDGDTYTIEFFANDTCDPSNHGEGQNFLGSILVVENDPEDFGPEPWETTLSGSLGEGEVVTATATSEDGSTSEFSECAAQGAAAAEATITLESDQASVIAGAQTVPTGGIDLADLKRGGGTTQSTPLDSIPLDSIPLDSVPLDSIPLDSIGFTADLLNQALGGVHLSDVPLSTPGGWPARLAGTALANVPLNTITLADVYRLNEGPGPDPVPLDSIPLDSIDLSGTPLDSIGLGAIAMGATPLDSIPLDSIGTNSATENAADWCAALNPPTGGGPDPVPGYSCPPIDPSTETLIGLTVRGVPLDSIPLDSIPLDSIPLDSIPLDSIPLDSIPLDSIPLDSIPLDSIPLDSIPLDSINFAVSPLDSIPLDSIGPGVIDCSGGYCVDPRTLGDADADGRIIQGATLFDLMGALQPGNGASIADLIYGLPTPPQLTLGDLFGLVIGGGQGTYDWSHLNLNTFPIALHSPDGGVITYHATFEVTGGSANPTATIHAALPEGGRYKPGSSQLIEGETTVPIGEPQVGPGQLEWTRTIQRNVQYELTWQVHAPLELGNYAIGANVIVPGMESAALSNAVDVDVIQTLEPNNDVGAGEELEDNTLYLGYMLPGDVDRHRIQIPAAFGSRVRVTLSHIAKDTDLDLAVAGPPSPTLRNRPGNTIPLQNAQLPDSKVELDERTQALPPETLQDVPTTAITQAPNVIRATSDNRGTADEEVNLISQGESGEYIVQVSDYEGDSPLPYMLEVEIDGPPNLGACDAPRSFPAEFAGQGVIGTMPAIPANVNTLILVNQQRLGRTYGNTAAQNVMNSLNELAGRADLGIVGAVIPVDSSLTIRNAYDAWDTNPCSPEAANNIVEQIGLLIDGIEPENLQYKVIVGGDDQIPFGRVADETILANEEEYAASLSGLNNQYKSAFGHGLLMTDDVYAEEAAPEFLGHELFVPDQAIGRLVETPNEITGMISAFLAPGVNGAITAQRSLTTGYDFLTDGANAVNAPFNTAFGASNARTLINETWPARDANTSPTDDLEDALFPASPTLPPQINAVNAHFDHTRLLPAAENAANRAVNLYTSQDVRNRGANAVAQRILFSMGCHSGLATSDAVYGSIDPMSKDWAQTFLAGGAFAWIGNTGFGLGDTEDVAYTERLHARFTANLTGALSLGEALAQAKQEYLSTLGIVSGYDAKVLMQTTLYGLPMLNITGGSGPATPPPLPLQTDAATGLQAASFNQTPTFTLVTRPDGKFYRAQSTQATNRRPIEPLVSFDVTQPGLIAHGVVITSLQSGADEANFDAAFSRIVTDKAEDEPELVGEASHPAKIQSISSFSHFASPATTRQNAVLIPGLYRSDGIPDPAGVGIHRLYNQIGGYVLYAPPSETDFTPPELGALDAIDIGSGSVGFGVDVTDADGVVEDVKVIYRDCAGVWRLSTLQNSGGTRWSGGGPLVATCEQIDYYLQGVDDAGNVAVSSKKVQVEPLVLPAPTGDTDITISLAGTQHSSGWYTSAVSVEITANPASPLKYSLSSLDEGELQNYTGAFSVGGTGVHFLEAFAEDGSSTTAAFAIDMADPTVLMTTPPAGAVYTLGQVVKANYTCADSGSGIASCNGSTANGANLDTSSLGMKTITVTATDMVGRTTTLPRNYNVVLRSILFASNRTGNGDIYVVPPTGGTPVQLTTGNAIDAEPEWFPGNEQIVFFSSRTGSGDIYSLDIRTGVLNQLTSHPAIDTSPAVSPNGLKIAFASNRGSGGNWDIYVMNIDGSNVQRLTTNGTDDLLPAWSPDSQQIAFFSARSGQGDIYKMSATGANQTRLTSGSSGNSLDTEPAWFGSTIAFSTNRHGDNNFEIYTMTTTGASQTRRTQQAGHDITPSWSGDGTKLAFASNRPPGGGLNFNIWTMNANGSSQTAIVTHGAADVFPDW